MQAVGLAGLNANRGCETATWAPPVTLCNAPIAGAADELAAELRAIVWLALGAPGGTAVRRLAVAAGACVLGAQVVFWTLTDPANVATADWTWMPADWEMLRRPWEYAHAGGATFQAGAMILLILAALIDTKPHGCP